MAMRRIWIIVGSVPMADGTITVQIEDGCRPAVYDNYLTAQDDCDDTNAEMQAAVDRGDLQDFDKVMPLGAWLLDETGVISVKDAGLGYEIPDLQKYCEEQGMV